MRELEREFKDQELQDDELEMQQHQKVTPWQPEADI